MKAKLVCIEWVDADGEGGWSTYNPKAKLVIIRTYGILVDNNDTMVVHADSYCHENKMWSGLGRIPKGMIKKIKVLMNVDL